MQTRRIIIVLSALVTAAGVCSADSHAAVGSTGATATIQTGINIAKDIDNYFSNTSGDLAFGTIVPDPVGGTVTINPSDWRRYTVLGTAGQNYGPAVFLVTAAINTSYSITLPSQPTTVRRGAFTMTVDNWTSNNASGITDSDGNSDFTVGGTLYVKANQGTGRYTGSFMVIAAYN